MFLFYDLAHSIQNPVERAVIIASTFANKDFILQIHGRYFTQILPTFRIFALLALIFQEVKFYIV